MEYIQEKEKRGKDKEEKKEEIKVMKKKKKPEKEEKNEEDEEKKNENKKLRVYFRSRYASFLNQIRENNIKKKEQEELEKKKKEEKAQKLREELGLTQVNSKLFTETTAFKLKQEEPIKEKLQKTRVSSEERSMMLSKKILISLRTCCHQGNSGCLS